MTEKDEASEKVNVGLTILERRTIPRLKMGEDDT